MFFFNAENTTYNTEKPIITSNFCFKGSRGQDGQKGDYGPKGDQGVPGPDGTPGLEGPEGPKVKFLMISFLFLK